MEKSSRYCQFWSTQHSAKELQSSSLQGIEGTPWHQMFSWRTDSAIALAQCRRQIQISPGPQLIQTALIVHWQRGLLYLGSWCQCLGSFIQICEDTAHGGKLGVANVVSQYIYIYIYIGLSPLTLTVTTIQTTKKSTSTMDPKCHWEVGLAHFVSLPTHKEVGVFTAWAQ